MDQLLLFGYVFLYLLLPLTMINPELLEIFPEIALVFLPWRYYANSIKCCQYMATYIIILFLMEKRTPREIPENWRSNNWKKNIVENTADIVEGKNTIYTPRKEVKDSVGNVTFLPDNDRSPQERG